MKQLFILSTSAILLLSSCGDSKKEGNASINDKKAQLEKLKGEKDKNDEAIRKLQDELAKLDTTSVNPAKIKLVALTPIAVQSFDHYINLQGKIDADNISYITPRGQGGQIKEIFIRQGDVVKKGQLLLKLDDAVQRQQVAAVNQQKSAVKTQLALAKSLYDRQKNLWDQGIGTEVQLLTAKTNVASLENQLSIIDENVKLAQEQMNSANVYSDVAGIADVVTVRVGESFPGMGIIKIVNTSSLKAVSNIPENYLGTVNHGTPVAIELQDNHKIINASVSFVGASIDAINRGFVVEAKLPSNPALKPNELALMKIRDYSAPNSIVVPLKTLQNDEKGKFVMIVTTDNGKLTAHKRPVIIGMLNDDQLEIKSGLKAGDMLVTEGFGTLYEGQQVKTDVK